MDQIMSKAFLAIVDGQPINIGALPEAVDRVVERALQRKGFSFFTLNLDHLVKLRSDRTFREAYRRATFISADGAPVVALARKQGANLQRTTGADMVLPLCAAAAARGIPIYLFGCTPESLAASMQHLKTRFPSLDIRGAQSPAFGFDPASDAADAAGVEIARSGAALCFVALGAPKQEVFADRMAGRHKDIGFICIGAALDFISGAQVRAPRIMQVAGLEWLWRLAGNPRRLAARYGRCATLLTELRFIAPLRSKITASHLFRTGF